MKDFWLERWENGNVPWHQLQVEPLLISHLPKNAAQLAFVPLCGKSLDMLWIANQGCKVIGSELSAQACEDFFKESKLSFKKTTHGDFEVFESDRVSLWAGDFFKLPLEILKLVDLIYDRASLIALPPDIRTEYISTIKQIAKNSTAKSFEMLLIGREQPGQTREGPPFMISKKDIESYYAKEFKIEVLASKTGEARPDIDTEYQETLYRLRPITSLLT